MPIRRRGERGGRGVLLLGDSSGRFALLTGGRGEEREKKKRGDRNGAIVSRRAYIHRLVITRLLAGGLHGDDSE